MRLNKVEEKAPKSGYSCRNRMPGLQVGTGRNHDQPSAKQLRRGGGSPHPGRYAAIGASTTRTASELIVDEQGTSAATALCDQQLADNPERALQQARDQLGKLGNTLFVARQIDWQQ